jgi:CRISPR-associated protein Cas2
MFCLICFDVSDDRKRYRVVKELLGVAVRVQKSVFECADLKEERYLKLKKKLEKLLDHSSDSIRYYFLCRGCVPRVEHSGKGEPPRENEEFKIV